MAWLVMNDQYYISVDSGGEVQLTADIEGASVFENKKQADEVFRNIAKPYKKLGYRVAPTNQPVNMELPERKKTNAEETPSVTPDMFDAKYYLSELKRFRSFIHSVEETQPKMEEMQIRAEQEIEDILHAAEFYDLDQTQGYELYRMLREARIRRRQCKDAAAWMSLILMARPASFLKSEPSERIAAWNDRCYRPRALPELFMDSTE